MRALPKSENGIDKNGMEQSFKQHMNVITKNGTTIVLLIPFIVQFLPSRFCVPNFVRIFKKIFEFFQFFSNFFQILSRYCVCQKYAARMHSKNFMHFLGRCPYGSCGGGMCCKNAVNSYILDLKNSVLVSPSMRWLWFCQSLLSLLHAQV